MEDKCVICGDTIPEGTQVCRRCNKSDNRILPCKIGDTVWAIRNFSGTLNIKQGKVSEMYYVGEEMQLCIVVKNVARGRWGKDIFPTYEEAEKRLRECQKKR